MTQAATEGQILNWISDQVQIDTDLTRQDANHFAGGLLTGWRLAKRESHGAICTEIEARGLARLAVEEERASTHNATRT